MIGQKQRITLQRVFELFVLINKPQGAYSIIYGTYNSHVHANVLTTTQKEHLYHAFWFPNYDKYTFLRLTYRRIPVKQS